VFESGSFLRSLNIYLVENVAQSLIALALVLAVVHVFKVRDHVLKIRLYLLPILLPLLAPPVYYLLFPGRSQMPVVKLDRLLALEKVIPYQQESSIWGPLLVLALLLAIGLVVARSAVAVFAMLLMPRYHRILVADREPALDKALASLTARAGVRQPRILVSESKQRAAGCFAFIGPPFLLLPARWLHGPNREVLEPALAHEIAHLKRGDHLLLPLLRFARGLLFFNPAVHMACMLIAREAELATDQMALVLGVPPVDYARGLLGAWRRAPLSAAPIGAGRGELKQRVETVLSPALTVNAPGWIFPATTAALGTGLFFLC
jgi:beta-lactamase regulating signal transducer with metallopeptidase domain